MSRIARIEKHLGELAAGHRLSHHGGMCEYLHGHNWTIVVWVDAEVDPQTGIAVDFLDFDALWKSWLDEFDHAMWLNAGDPLVGALRDAGVKMKLVQTPGDPTAEIIAGILLERLAAAVPQGTAWGVRVSEMAGCWAEAAKAR